MENDVNKKLIHKRVRPTSMRELVYGILDKQKKALSLYEIEQQFDNVDRSTIFRTLKTFQENCVIHRIDDGTGAVKYALCDENCTCHLGDLHVHFLCVKCGQTHCLKDMPIPKMDLPDGFSFKSANFVVKGTCPRCS